MVLKDHLQNLNAISFQTFFIAKIHNYIHPNTCTKEDIGSYGATFPNIGQYWIDFTGAQRRHKNVDFHLGLDSLINKASPTCSAMAPIIKLGLATEIVGGG